MQYTDHNVPMDCGDCMFKCEGISDMETHVHRSHGYSWDEAKRYAQEWAEDAHIRIAEWEQRRALEYKRGY